MKGSFLPSLLETTKTIKADIKKENVKLKKRVKRQCPICGSLKTKIIKKKNYVRILSRPKFYFNTTNLYCLSCEETLVDDDTQTNEAIEKAEFDFVYAFLQALLKTWNETKYINIERILHLEYGTIQKYIKAKKFSLEFVNIVKLIVLCFHKDKNFDLDEIFKLTYISRAK